jgi:hypothetical protein
LNGLLAIRQPDDAQASRAETDAGTGEKTFFVRTAVNERIRHALHKSLGDRAISAEVNNAGDSAHPFALGESRPEWQDFSR